MNFIKNSKNRGISIIEIVILITIVAVGLSGILSLATFCLKVLASIERTNQAISLAQETIEQAKNYRDGVPWDNDDPIDEYDGLGVLIIGVPYHFEKSSDTPPKWKLVQGEEILQGGYNRKIVFGLVQRDIVTDDIDSPGDYFDNNTKKIIATASWSDKKVEIETYLTSWR